MAIAASLWFDRALETWIRQIWAQIAVRGISSRLHEGPYRPHITLGVWEGIDPEQFALALKEKLSSVAAFEVTFAAVGWFPDSPGVVFFQPSFAHDLLDLRDRVLKVASQLKAQPASWYPAGPWFPHCTMAWELTRDQVLSAVDLLLAASLPLIGQATAVGIVDTPAEIELERVDLRSEEGEIM